MKLPDITYSFVPKYVSNAVFSGVWNLLRICQRLSRKDYSAHFQANEAAFQDHIDTIQKNKGYIEDQNNYTDMAYGGTTMQYAGCPVFATYNALYQLTGANELTLPQLIAAYEHDGMVLSAKGGTPPKAIRDFLKKQGYQTILVTNRKKFDGTAQKSRALILTMYNNAGDIRDKVHTVHVSKENGQYIAHNVYCNGQAIGPCNSLTELMDTIHRGRSKIIAMIGIL